jgi:hypothetical protein
MTVSTIIDDLANRRDLGEVLAMADEGEIPLWRLRRMAYGSASVVDIERHGEHWLLTLVDLLQRGGIGALERRAGGQVVFVFADSLPTADEAWERSQPELDDPDLDDLDLA